MRRPNRRPNYTEMEDITNWEETAKYVIVLDGTTYKAYNGNTGEIDSQSTSAHTVIQYAIDNGGTGVVSVKTDVTLTAAITGAANIILDFNGHTITPATSFDMFTLALRMTLKNVLFDVSGLAFTHKCIQIIADATVAGAGTGYYFTKIENCIGRSVSGQGIFFYVDCTADLAEMYRLRVMDCQTESFEYGYKVDVTGTNAWFNGNIFKNLYGQNDTYFIYLNLGAGAAELSLNTFTFDYNTKADTDTLLYVDGSRNTFIGNLWDVGAGNTAVNFVANSENNLLITPAIELAYITDAGTGNMIFEHSSKGFIGASEFNFFKETAGNPNLNIYGDVAGVEKSCYIQMDSAGRMRIGNATGAGMRIYSTGTLDLVRAASGDISCFTGCGTDDNKLIKIYGRNNADDNSYNVSMQWGDGTHEDGEIKTSSGDLRLTPATGVVMFGTKTGGGDVVSDGYVTIKDAAGNSVKLMTTA